MSLITNGRLFNSRSQTACLSFFHALPVDKSVNVIDQKRNKANNHRKIRCVLRRCNDPEYDQYNIVCGVNQGEEGTSPEGQIYGNKACGDRKRADNDAGGAKRFQNKVKSNGNGGRQNKHKNDLFFAEPVYLDLGSVAVVRVSQPRNKGEKSHRSGHSKVCYHFTVIGVTVGYNAV